MYAYLLRLLRTPAPQPIPAHRLQRAVVGSDLAAYLWCNKASAHDD